MQSCLQWNYTTRMPTVESHQKKTLGVSPKKLYPNIRTAQLVFSDELHKLSFLTRFDFGDDCGMTHLPVVTDYTACFAHVRNKIGQLRCLCLILVGLMLGIIIFKILNQELVKCSCLFNNGYIDRSRTYVSVCAYYDCNNSPSSMYRKILKPLTCITIIILTRIVTRWQKYTPVRKHIIKLHEHRLQESGYNDPEKWGGSRPTWVTHGV